MDQAPPVPDRRPLKPLHPGTWDVLQCGRCLYRWRTTEPARRTPRDAYPQEFRLTPADIDYAPEVPAIPPLETR